MEHMRRMQSLIEAHPNWFTFYNDGLIVIRTADPSGPMMMVWPDRAAAEAWRQGNARAGSGFMAAWTIRALSREDVNTLFRHNDCTSLAVGLRYNDGQGLVVRDYAGTHDILP